LFEDLENFWNLENLAKLANPARKSLISAELQQLNNYHHSQDRQRDRGPQALRWKILVYSWLKNNKYLLELEKNCHSQAELSISSFFSRFARFSTFVVSKL
jgi:hypothetical protein